MQKFPGLHIKILLIVLTLFFSIIACKTPDAIEVIKESVAENCHEIDRETYESLAAELGQTPETPEYPEGAVYEACSPKKVGGFDIFGKEGEISSIRMSEGYKPEPEKEFPAGTYNGETTFLTTLDTDVDNSYLPPVCSQNYIRLEIGSDRVVQGEVRSICYAMQDTDNPEMKQTHHSEVIGLIHGTLVENSSQIFISYTWHTYFTSPQWDSPSLDHTVEFEFPYHVSVTGNVMSLTPAADIESFYSFTLFR